LDRPEFTDWASDESQVIEPAGGLKATGFAPSDAPPAQYHNWLWRMSDKWHRYLDALTQETIQNRLADELRAGASATNVVSSSHNWNFGAISNISADPAIVTPRFWVVGDNGAGSPEAALAYSDTGGVSWIDATAAVQVGSLTHAAAYGTLCMGVGGGLTHLVGSSNDNTVIPGGSTASGVVYDPTNDVWVMTTGLGIYTSPATAITWTQRQAGDFRGGVAWYNGRLYATAWNSPNAEVYTSTDATAWALAVSFASGAAPVTRGTLANARGVFLVTSGPGLWTAPTHGATLTFTDVTPAGPDPTGAFVWCGVLCLPGVYFSDNPADDEWRGAYPGFNPTLLAGGDHGALALFGNQNIATFRTINLGALPFAV
jgi:hypothetical protein